MPPPTINYALDNDCDNDGSVFPQITNANNANFSASPAWFEYKQFNGSSDFRWVEPWHLYRVHYNTWRNFDTDQIVVNETYQINNSMSTCSNEPVFLQGADRTTSGTYTSNLQTVFGCDSVVVTDLIVFPAFIDEEVFEICEGDSALIDGIYRKTAGFYNDSFTKINGCDSIFVKELVVYPIESVSSDMELCFKDSVLLFGTYRKTAGTYSETIQSTFGCDSTNIVNLTVKVVNPNMNVVDSVFQVVQANAVYQWINCATGANIPGAVNQSFIPTANGSYQCLITFEGCSDTSQCKSINDLGIEEFDDNEVLIFPNPNNGQFSEICKLL